MKLKKDGTPKLSGGKRPNAGCKPKPHELKKTTLFYSLKNADIELLGGLKNTDKLVKDWLKKEIVRRREK